MSLMLWNEINWNWKFWKIYERISNLMSYVVESIE